MASSLTIRSEPAQGRRAIRVALAVGVGILLVGGLVASTRSSIFRVRGVDVAGNRHLSHAQVVSLSRITSDTNAIWLDEGAIETRLEADGWIDVATVQVRPPWTVQITVQEREAVAVARHGGERVLVAGDGTVLGTAGRTPGLPLIDLEPPRGGARRSAPLTAPARTAAELSPRLLREVRRVVLTSNRGVELVLRGGLRVRIGNASELEDKMSVLREVMRWMNSTGEPIRRVDVSAPTAPAVEPGR